MYHFKCKCFKGVLLFPCAVTWKGKRDTPQYRSRGLRRYSGCAYQSRCCRLRHSEGGWTCKSRDRRATSDSQMPARWVAAVIACNFCYRLRIEVSALFSLFFSFSRVKINHWTFDVTRNVSGAERQRASRGRLLRIPAPSLTWSISLFPLPARKKAD